jgi:hypothetical protein
LIWALSVVLAAAEELAVSMDDLGTAFPVPPGPGPPLGCCLLSAAHIAHRHQAHLVTPGRLLPLVNDC